MLPWVSAWNLVLEITPVACKCTARWGALRAHMLWEITTMIWAGALHLFSCRELDWLEVQVLGFAIGVEKEWGEDQVTCISKCKYLCVGGSMKSVRQPQ